MTRLCILLFCGLPASGKSTCAHLLKDSANGRFSGSGDTDSPAFPAEDDDSSSRKSEWHHAENINPFFIHVAYDKILTEDIERELLSQTAAGSQYLELQYEQNAIASTKRKEQEFSKWKRYRKEILKCVGKHISEFVLSGKNDTGSRLDLCCPQEDIWDAFMKSIKTSPTENVLEGSKDNRDIVYIIDDNMYYRSMRYEYFQLAREYAIGFAQIYFETAIEIIHTRNNRRQIPVLSEVIATMASRIEPPGGPDLWDKHTLRLNSEHDAKQHIPTVLQLIKAALFDPVPLPGDEDEEEREAARVVCSTNVIHQADQILRRLVAQSMTQAKDKGHSKKNMKELATTMNSRRQLILEDMRLGKLLVDKKYIDEAHAGRHQDSALYLFVTSLFEESLND